MQFASVLSDLTSLRICEPSAALALVSAPPSPSTTTSGPSMQPTNDTDADPDFLRPQILRDLHFTVKQAYFLPTPDPTPAYTRPYASSASYSNQSRSTSTSINIPSALADLHAARDSVNQAVSSLGLKLQGEWNSNLSSAGPEVDASTNGADRTHAMGQRDELQTSSDAFGDPDDSIQERSEKAEIDDEDDDEMAAWS